MGKFCKVCGLEQGANLHTPTEECDRIAKELGGTGCADPASHHKFVPAEHRKVYLGDSVYAEMTEGMLKLTTENGLPTDPSNEIFLEPEVYEALKKFMEEGG